VVDVQDPRINWIVNPVHKHRELRGLTASGRKYRGMQTRVRPQSTAPPFGSSLDRARVFTLPSAGLPGDGRGFPAVAARVVRCTRLTRWRSPASQMCNERAWVRRLTGIERLGDETAGSCRQQAAPVRACHLEEEQHAVPQALPLNGGFGGVGSFVSLLAVGCFWALVRLVVG
jgi:hypothetical protein